MLTIFLFVYYAYFTRGKTKTKSHELFERLRMQRQFNNFINLKFLIAFGLGNNLQMTQEKFQVQEVLVLLSKTVGTISQ